MTKPGYAVSVMLCRCVDANLVFVPVIVDIELKGYYHVCDLLNLSSIVALHCLCISRDDLMVQCDGSG